MAHTRTGLNCLTVRVTTVSVVFDFLNTIPVPFPLLFLTQDVKKKTCSSLTNRITLMHRKSKFCTGPYINRQTRVSHNMTTLKSSIKPYFPVDCFFLNTLCNMQ